MFIVAGRAVFSTDQKVKDQIKLLKEHLLSLQEQMSWLEEEIDEMKQSEPLPLGTLKERIRAAQATQRAPVEGEQHVAKEPAAAPPTHTERHTGKRSPGPEALGER